MIVSFHDQGTADIFHGVDSALARRVCPSNVAGIARRKLEQLDSVSRLLDLRTPPGNRLEFLSGDREGQFSIRINQHLRVCFRWGVYGPCDVEITDYH
jgi:proteic killer suppression protein